MYIYCFVFDMVGKKSILKLFCFDNFVIDVGLDKKQKRSTSLDRVVMLHVQTNNTNLSRNG